MKTLLLFLFAISAYGQDTLFTAKSVYENKTITGYVICAITKTDTTFKRVEKHSEIPKSVHWRKDYNIQIKHYPKALLRKNEHYRCNLRTNKK